MKTCSLCAKPCWARGYCQTHYSRWWRTKTPGQDSRKSTKSLCPVSNCKNLEKVKGVCDMHYQRYRRTGSYELQPLAPRKRRKVGSVRVDKRSGYAIIITENGEKSQHRYVMEQHLGRPLYSFETVHHKNGQRADNRLENLELWATYQPSGQRVEDLLAFVKQHYSDML